MDENNQPWKAWRLQIDRIRYTDAEDSELLSMIGFATFEKIWEDIINSLSSTVATQEAVQFLLSYRILSNLLTKRVGSALISFKDYNRLLIQTFLSAAMKCNLFSARTQTVSCVIKSFSFENHSLLLNFVYEIECPDPLLMTMSGGWAMKSLQILLKKSRAFAVGNEVYYRTFIHAFISKAVQEVETVVVIEELTLVHPASELFSTIVLEYFAPMNMYSLIERIALLWGQPLFIAQGDDQMQRHLHFMLEWLLVRVSDPSLLTSTGGQEGDSGARSRTPLVVLLTRGVSAQLDSTDRATRTRAARIAKLFSSLLGHELNLSVSGGTDDTPQAVQTSEPNSKQMRVQALSVTIPGEGESEAFNNESDNDSDSEFSELEAFEIVEKKPLDGSAVYLRKCLEMLRCPESQEDAYQKHNGALTSLPAIVASAPVDGMTMAAPLMRELLRMQNAFNMEHFKELQSAAVQSLLVAHPGVTVPLITGAITAPANQADLTLGGKLSALGDLILAAHALAGIDMKDTFETHGNPSAMITAANSNSRKECEDRVESKTRVKRPAKLAQYKAYSSGEAQGVVRNRFGPVAQLFFSPVLRVLTTLLRRPVDATPALVPPAQSGSTGLSLLGGVGDDSTDSLLIAQCLLALGAFVRCSLNTPHQRNFVSEGLKISLACKDAASLTIRRAQLSTLLSCMESWLLLVDSRIRANSSSTSETRGGASSSASFGASALSNLTSITGGSGSDNDIGSNKGARYDDLELMMLVTQCLEWIMAGSGQDPDLHSRVLKVEILRIASLGLQREDSNTY